MVRAISGERVSVVREMSTGRAICVNRVINIKMATRNTQIIRMGIK